MGLDVGEDLLLGELADGRPHLALLGREVEVGHAIEGGLHGSSGPGESSGSTSRNPSPSLRAAMKKSTTLPHRNRRKTARVQAKKKAKLRKVRLRKSSGQRASYR